MAGKRLWLMLKWALFLLVTEFVLYFVILVIIGLIAGLTHSTLSNTMLSTFSLIVSQIVFLAFVYWFCYKATIECLKKGLTLKSTQGNMIGQGTSFSIGVALLTEFLTILVVFLISGKFNFAIGFIPLALAWIAGSKAEKNFFGK
jgi:hypothetical protein